MMDIIRVNKGLPFLVFIVLLICGCGSSLKPSVIIIPAPSQLPHTSREMNTAGYWISRHPFPDKPFLTPQEINKLNQSIRDHGLVTDLTQWSQRISGEKLKIEFFGTFRGFQSGLYYTKDGRQAQTDFFSNINANLNLEKIGDTVQSYYGFVVHYADQRFFPTAEPLYAKAFDVDFDELQNSALDVGTPVVILHQSADKKWVFVESPLSSGWVEADKVAVGALDKFKSYLTSENFYVVVVSKADIFLDPAMTKFYESARMGVKLPAVKMEKENICAVLIPQRDANGLLSFTTGYIANEQVHAGYFSYTPRIIIQQAFNMLNQPYGWGGMYGEQDCSQFLQEIFATVGIELPRDSKNQVNVGKPIGSFNRETPIEKKLDVLNKQAVGGITTLGMKGHIMLFLGNVDGRPFAIHSVWAYREPGEKEDIIRVINKVTVSDLFLGEGSKKGSLLERLQYINLLGN